MAKTATKPTAPRTSPAQAVTPVAAKPMKGTKAQAAAPLPAPEKARLVTLSHMAVAYAEKPETSRKEAASLLAGIFDTVTRHVKDGDKVRIAGLGTIEVPSRAARMGRNPASGEAIQIAASRKIAFRPAKKLKQAIQAEVLGTS